ncbi:MAG: DUF1990 family protein [Microcystaceae cyanobacterium]
MIWIMYLLTKPTTQEIYQHLEKQAKQPFSYADVGASLKLLQISNQSLSHLPAHYVFDHNRVQLGTGGEAFERSKIALGCWEMFRFNWIQLLAEAPLPIQAGLTVGILLRQWPVWVLNTCRIIDVVEEECGTIKRFGFAYGTLPEHGLSGEERFLVEWEQESDTVWYDLLAFSRPNQLMTQIGYLYVRSLQKRFAKASKEAMTVFTESNG